MELTREEDRKLQRAILHTAGKYTQEDLSEYSEEDKKVIEGYMAAWDGVHVTVSNFVQGEYSVVGWPPEEDEKAKNAIYMMEQDPTFGTYVDDREGFDAAWSAGTWEPIGSIVFPPEMVEILGDLEKVAVGDDLKKRGE